ncbi:hypothetical protein Poli38472_001963 [Pythium oligandrum]|uniref:Protein ARV n=1 Tax=Pythium oligandrum TaxID=41045 RepID=A0A8K1CVR5_PYTOL|nr:hypothetical protein Poli38472_001963 [Pythium oligandrum]|eukprot:TMW69807.1 hypothetical protein Poli38472_001963 [Pythium oligandrum]
MTSTSSRSYVCVSCGASVPYLVRDYGKGNVRLAICGQCNAVADPYVEYENILLFLEVMLLKPQVYRHVLYNLAEPPAMRTILKLFLILVMLDMNVKAYLIDRREGVAFQSESMYQQDAGHEISGFRVSQYSLHLVCLALLENLVYLAMILAVIWMDPLGRGWRQHLVKATKPSVDKEKTQQVASIVLSHDALVRYGMAMCVSSFGKMFALLTVIWEFHWTFVHVIGALVVCSNALALQLLLGEPSSTSVGVLFLLLSGITARFLTQSALYALGNSPFFYVFA